MKQDILGAITAVGGYVPDHILTNDDISKMVDTSDEWITTRVGIKERRILTGEGLGSSYLGTKAVEDMLQRHRIDPTTIDAVICSSNTPDYHFPTTASIIAHNTGITNAMCMDVQAACAGFLYVLDMAAAYVMSGKHRKVLVVAAEKMSAATDYTDRATCPLFGDAAGCALIEPNTEGLGVVDTILKTDGSYRDSLIMEAGGSAHPASHETVEARKHFVYQDGQTVFKAAVTHMGDTSMDLLKKHGLTHEKIAWVVAHQANLRIIKAVANRMKLPMEKLMLNIEKYGNTSSATIPLCLWEYEKRLKKGDNIILTAFGAGFTWGAVYLKWAYDYE